MSLLEGAFRYLVAVVAWSSTKLRCGPSIIVFRPPRVVPAHNSLDYQVESKNAKTQKRKSAKAQKRKSAVHGRNSRRVNTWKN